MNSRFSRLIASVAAALLVACAAQAQPSSDEWITTKMSVALYSFPEIDPRDVNVDSKDGQLTLSGTVPSAEAKQKVVAAAREVEGVKGIRDDLQIAPPPPESAPRAHLGTDELRGQVLKKLSLDPQLRDNSITVGARDGGVVVLGGFADSLSDQLRALRIARGVGGVETVMNEMKSPPDTLHDPLPAEGVAGGEDARNRRERQALDGRAAEDIPGQAGDAPRADDEPDPAAVMNPEGDQPHSPTTDKTYP